MKRIIVFLVLLLAISDLKSQNFPNVDSVKKFLNDSIAPNRALKATTINKAYNAIAKFLPDAVADTGTVTIKAHGMLKWQRSDSTLYVYDTIGSKRWRKAVPGGSGEVNTMSSAGAGYPVFNAKAGVDFPMRTLSTSDFNVSGSNFTIDATLKANWNNAFGWGNHASAGYASQSELDDSMAAVRADFPSAGTPTTLSTGTRTTTTYGITSDGGTDDVVLAAATTSLAGLLTAADKARLDSLYDGNITDSVVYYRVTGSTYDSAYVKVYPYGGGAPDSLFMFLLVKSSGGSSDPVTKFSTGLLQNYNFNKYNKKPNRYELQEFGYSTAVATKNNDALFPTYRDGASAITVNDTAAILGGWYTTGPTVFDSVYYSLDGFKTKTYLGLQPWGAMHSFPLFEGDDGYWYQIGGDYLSTSTQKKSVWRSATPLNMASWTRVTSTAPFSTILGEATSWNDTLYYMGGQFGTASSISWTNDGKSDTVWRSTDGGANWTFHAKIAGNIINKNISGTGVKFNNRFYLVGGGRYDGTVLSARTFDSTVYSTTDFVNWRQEQSFPGRGVQYPAVTVWDGKLWCLFGDSAQATNTNLIYYMTKDGNWHNYINYDSSGTALPVTHAAAVTVWKDQILLPNANNLNKAYSIHRSNYISNPDAPITYLTPIRFDTAMGNPNTGVQVFGSKYSGSFVESMKTYYDGTLHFKQKSSINTPASTYTSLYFKTSDGLMYYKTPAGTEYGPITGSNGIEVGVTGITGGTSTNIPYNGSGAYSESSNLQWDNTNQLIQTGRGFRVKSGYTFLTETGGGLSTILGNSVKRSATSAEVEKTSSDPGSYLRLSYVDGMTFHTNFTGAAPTSVAEANNQAGGFDLSKVFYVGPKATKDFSITSAGKISKYGNSAPANGEIMIGHTSNGTFEKTTLTAGVGTVITNGAGSITISGNSTSGTYTPTLTGVANVAASTAYQFKWSRTDSTYTVSGEVDIDPTTTATLTQLGISFPPVVTGTIANTYDAAGTAGDDLGTSARIVGDVANGRFELRMTPTDVTNRRFSVIIQFKVNAP